MKLVDNREDNALNAHLTKPVVILTCENLHTNETQKQNKVGLRDRRLRFCMQLLGSIGTASS